MLKPDAPVFEKTELSFRKTEPGSVELTVVAKFDFLWHARAALFLISFLEECRSVSWQYKGKTVTANSRDYVMDLIAKRNKIDGRRSSRRVRKTKSFCSPPAQFVQPWNVTRE